MSVKAQVLFFIAPEKLEVREVSLPMLKTGQVLVETRSSLISAGTEMLVFRGQFPKIHDLHDGLSSDMTYPMPYGYACAGKVIQVGPQVSESWLGKSVFSFHAHASHFIEHTENLISVPEDVSFERACFLPNMETAVNLVQDGAPILGEKILVLGQGIVGLLTTSLLGEFPLDQLATVDVFESRRKASAGIGKVTALAPEQIPAFIQENGKFDAVFELSGVPAALNDAITNTIFSGRIIIGSWYGQKSAAIDLGGVFHRSRIKLISSQVSTISPELSGRWNKHRRFDLAWKALNRIEPEKWITHRMPLDDTQSAYELLHRHPELVLQIAFDYS